MSIPTTFREVEMASVDELEKWLKIMSVMSVLKDLTTHQLLILSRIEIRLSIMRSNGE